MWNLALSCAFFLCIHLMISGTSMKDQIISGIGAFAYYALFTLFSVSGLLWMSISFALALHNADNLNMVFWGAPLFLRIVALVGDFIAFILIIVGFLSPSPGNLLALRRLPEKPVYGITRISRHPVLAGISIWAIMHIICNGNLASWLFFGTMLVTCVLGANNIDRKRTAVMGDAYRSIMDRTSIIPFVAIIQGRTAFAPEEIGLARVFLAISMFSVFTVLHEMLFIVSAL